MIPSLFPVPYSLFMCFLTNSRFAGYKTIDESLKVPVIVQSLFRIAPLEARVAADVGTFDVFNVETPDALLTLLKRACQLLLGCTDHHVHCENHLGRAPFIVIPPFSYCLHPAQIGMPSALIPPQKKHEFDT